MGSREYQNEREVNGRKNKRRRRRGRRGGRDGKKVWMILAVVLLTTAGIGAGLFLRDMIVQKSSEKKLNELAININGENNPAAERSMTYEEKCQAIRDKYGIEVPEKNINFEELRSGTNADIYAWLFIPGTIVDYPVVQHPTDNQYYLDYNLDGTRGYPGCIYSQNCNAKDFSDVNTILYGHNMNDGTMFGDLMRYKDRTFFDENSVIFVYTEKDVFVYRIVAARVTNDDHQFTSYDFDTEEGISFFMAGITGDRDLRNHYNEEEELNADRKILTLSTCVNEVPEERYLVQGVLLEA